MLEFIVGRAGSGKTAACLRDMRGKLEEAPMGPALVLLLPEHMTYKAERELAASLSSGGGYMRAHVFGFRRFMRQVLLETGGLAHPRITDVGRSILLKKILERRKEELAVFQQSARQKGFSHSLSESIQEMKSYGLTATKLSKAAEEVEQPGLSRKLRDLSLLLSDFQEEMKGRYNDREDMMEILAEKMPKARFLHGAEIWIDGFIFFNPQERRILEELMKIAAHVHISLAMDPALHSRENLRQTGLFHRSWETMETLRSMAESLGISCRFRTLTKSRRWKEAALCQMEQQLFAFPPQPVAAGEGVVIVEAAARRLEVEAVASDILRLCREKGYRFRDIGILIREESYENLLEFILEEHGIPFFRDGKRSASHHPLAELVRSSFEALRGWRYEPLFRCFRTGFFPVTWEQLDRLENYVLEFGIRGRRHWISEEDWHWQRHFAGEGSEGTDEKVVQALAEVNFIRREAAKHLQDLQRRVGDARNAEQLTTALYEFLMGLQIPATLEAWAKRAEEEGRLAAAKEHRQIWDDMMSLMDQIVEVSGSEKMSLRDYETILSEGLEALQISLIPPGLDYVSVAPFDQNSLANSPAIYILGVNEGIMPRRSGEKGLFTDAERLHLMEAGVEISSGGLEGSLAENYLLYRGFTEAREYVWISYSLTDAAGDGLLPSPLVGRLRAMLPRAGFLSVSMEGTGLFGEGQENMGYRFLLDLADGRQALSGFTAALREKKEGKGFPEWWGDVYNWLLEQPSLRIPRDAALAGIFAKAGAGALPEDLAKALFMRRNRLSGSVTRFEGFHRCPFQHFARYGLRLQDRQEYRFQALDLGTLLHETLRAFGEQLKSEGRRWRDVGEEECHDMCGAILGRLMPLVRNELLMSTAQYRHQQNRILSVAERSIRRLVALDAVSRFHPQVYERSFGVGTMAPLVYFLKNGARLEIMGQIDRMDVSEDGRYFLVMDYKTGKGAINLLEVYYGLRMQLLTYLLVAKNLLSKEEEMLPAGILYFFLKYPIYTSGKKIGQEEAEKEIRKQLKMPGWVLADPEVIRAIDSSQEFIKVRLGKTGINGADMSKVKTAEEFSVLLDYIDNLLASTGEEILSGDIRPYPYRLGDEVPCSLCPYRAVCGFDLQLEGFGYRELEVRSDDELIAAMKTGQKEEQQVLRCDTKSVPLGKRRLEDFASGEI